MSDLYDSEWAGLGYDEGPRERGRFVGGYYSWDDAAPTGRVERTRPRSRSEDKAERRRRWDEVADPRDRGESMADEFSIATLSAQVKDLPL